MKWLIFQAKGGVAETQKIVDFLTEKNVTYIVYEFDLPHIDDSSSIKLSEHIEHLEKLCEMLTDTTHCVLVNIQRIPIVGSFLYALGMLKGADIPVFVTLGMLKGAAIPVFIADSKNYFPDCLLNVFFPVCPDAAELLRKLEKHFPLFLEEELHHAARQKLFDLGVPLTPDSFSQYISLSDTEICTLFVETGMDVNSCDAAGTPMLCVAARNGILDMAQWLIDKNANINAVSSDRGYTPIMDAVWKDNYELTELFIKSGADLNVISKDGQPLLVLATGVGNIKICKLLAKNGADANIKDRMGMSALEYAKLFKKQVLIDAFEEASK